MARVASVLKDTLRVYVSEEELERKLTRASISPKDLSWEPNPEFEAFRRQSKSGHSFNLGYSNHFRFASTSRSATSGDFR
jgi:hypothetical protein